MNSSSGPLAGPAAQERGGHGTRPNLSKFRKLAQRSAAGLRVSAIAGGHISGSIPVLDKGRGTMTAPDAVRRRIAFMHRRHLLLGAAALTFASSFTSAAWANVAEDFVSGNIQAGFDILNDKTASPAQRRERFAAFLLALTDVKRIALFMLGRYAANAPPADLDAYVAAYQDYATSRYQSYFGLYSGQSLHVMSSRERAPGDFVVTTNMVGANSSPLEIDFRVRTDGAKPVLVDLGVAGIWLALAQRDEFLSVMAQNNGDIKALTAHLRVAQQR
jgi:phospholipid transport system substrate-binding protein